MEAGAIGTSPWQEPVEDGARKLRAKTLTRITEAATRNGTGLLHERFQADVDASRHAAE